MSVCRNGCQRGRCDAGELLKDLWKKQSRILDWNGNGMLDYVLVEGEDHILMQSAEQADSWKRVQNFR